MNPVVDMAGSASPQRANRARLAALECCAVVLRRTLDAPDAQFEAGAAHLLPPDAREIGRIIRVPAQAAGLSFETRPDRAVA